MFKKSEAFDLYIDELINKKLRKLSAIDGKYANVKSKIMFEAEAMESDFTQEDIKIIEDFKSLLYQLSFIENRYLYLEGFIDCMELLKRLRVY